MSEEVKGEAKPVVDKVMPEDKWSFDADVTECFDDMLRRSIPQYDVMRRAVFDVGSRFLVDSTHLVDIGSSRGEAVQAFIDRFGARINYDLIEISDPMLDVLRARFAGWIKNGHLRVNKMDLRQDFPSVPASLVLAVLTIQFVPIEHRQRLIRRAYKTLRKGGAMIIVEKVLGDTSELDDMMVDTYYQMKREKGYTQEAIDRKRMSLEGVLVPMTARWNVDMLERAGFEQIDCMWRWMNFAAWIAVK